MHIIFGWMHKYQKMSKIESSKYSYFVLWNGIVFTPLPPPAFSMDWSLFVLHTHLASDKCSKYWHGFGLYWKVSRLMSIITRLAFRIIATYGGKGKILIFLKSDNFLIDRCWRKTTHMKVKVVSNTSYSASAVKNLVGS